MKEKLEKFIDRVAFRVEEALQSNEIINVLRSKHSRHNNYAARFSNY